MKRKRLLTWVAIQDKIVVDAGALIRKTFGFSSDGKNTIDCSQFHQELTTDGWTQDGIIRTGDTSYRVNYIKEIFSHEQD